MFNHNNSNIARADKEEPTYFENFDLETNVTPVKIEEFRNLLESTGYNQDKIEYLVDGFENGFDLGYRGPENIKQTAPNLKFTIGNKTILWNKVMKEVENKRYAGPFKEIPYEYFIQSPIGLVPKDNGKKTRLIFHLSYPRDCDPPKSVNANTPEELSRVHYKDFDDAIRICIKLLENGDEELVIYLGKSDLSNAFRNLPIKRGQWCYLVMKAQSPFDGQMYYFVDKCLPFGASVSCAVFQAFSDALAHVVRVITGEENVNYLDDYLFLSLLEKLCNLQLQEFLNVCRQINFPVSLDKTEWATSMLTFLGLTIDGKNKLVRIPTDKINKALKAIDIMLNKKKNKTTLRELQQLCGYLNFLGKAIIPGRAFTRRMYAQGENLTKPHHHLKVKPELKADLEMWKQFLTNEKIFARPFFDFAKNIHYVPQNFYTDASSKKGCGGICGENWFIVQWEEDFLTKYNPSINYLELYALTIGIISWIKVYQNGYVTLYCDNQSVIHMVNKSSSKCPHCMVLIRIITLHCMIYNVKIKIDYVPSKSNTYADYLSRLKYKEFRQLARTQNKKFNKNSTTIPRQLQDIEKLFIGY